MTVRLTLKSAQSAQGQRKSYVYNAVDCIATRMIRDVLGDVADEATMRTYGMERAVQNAAFAMSLRGVLVDETLRAKRAHELTLETGKLKRKLAKHPTILEVWDQLAIASDPKIFGAKAGKCPKSTRKDGRHVWPRGVEDSVTKLCECCGMPRLRVSPFSATSPTQCGHLFYDLLKCKKQYNKDHKVSTDEDCMERIAKSKKIAEPIARAILDIRDIDKQLTLLNARLRDGRFATSFNVGVASTGRWSSNADMFHCGGNIQNIPERHRDIFIADPGKVLFYADLKQAESKSIAHYAGDELYIAAHEDDTHTFVCNLVWPEGLNGNPWPKDKKDWAKFAKSHLPAWDNVAGHDYRFQSKAVQHGSNLGLTAFGMAMQKHMPVAAASEGQQRYFRAFQGIRPFQNWVRMKVEAQEPIVNCLGVRFLLYGRPWDEHTFKQGLAVLPQSTVAHIINLAAEQVFNELDPWNVQLLGQIHDALLGQCDEAEAIPTMKRVYELMSIPVPVTDIKGVTRWMTIEPELAIGRNWKHAGKENPEGLKGIEL